MWAGSAIERNILILRQVNTLRPITLRDYQRKAKDRVIESLHEKPILVAPTGSGKTVMGAAIIETIGRPTQWLAHRKELVEQAAEQLRAFGLHVGIIMAGHQPDPSALVQVASIQTLAKRQIPHADLIMIDEAHHAVAKTYETVLSALPDAALLGMTATPFRLDGSGLGDVFGRLIVAAHADELVAGGSLIAPRVFVPNEPDLAGVKKTTGDFSPSALGTKLNRPGLVADVVEQWIRHAFGRRTVAFACNVKHSQAIVAAFNKVNIPAEHLDGKVTKKERAAILERLRSGETLVVSNCGIVSEGFDLPDLSAVIIARPTESLCLHLQMVGRVMRPSPGKVDAIVLDHAGNHLRHGLVTDRIDFSLKRSIKTTKPKLATRETLTGRVCKACKALITLPAETCSECGAAFSHIPTHADGQLGDFSLDPFQVRVRAWEDIESQRRKGRRSRGWSFYRFKERFGEWPVVDDESRLVDPARATMAQKCSVFRRLQQTGIIKGFKPGWAAHEFKNIFGEWPTFPRRQYV